MLLYIFRYLCHMFCLGILAKTKRAYILPSLDNCKIAAPHPTLNPKRVLESLTIQDFVIVHFSRFEDNIYFATPRFSHSTKMRIF